MDESWQKPAMDQKIFEMNLSVGTVSAYLLCCSLADAGTTVSTKNLTHVWNGTKEELLRALKQLEKSGIVQSILSACQEENTVYRLVPAQRWVKPAV